MLSFQKLLSPSSLQRLDSFLHYTGYFSFFKSQFSAVFAARRFTSPAGPGTIE